MLLINTIPLRKASWSRSWPRYCHRTGICCQKFRKFTMKSSAKVRKSFNNNFIFIYFQVLFASEQFPRLNTLILRFVFEKIVFHPRFIFVLPCCFPSWLNPTCPGLLKHICTPDVIRVWFRLGFQIFLEKDSWSLDDQKPPENYGLLWFVIDWVGSDPVHKGPPLWNSGISDELYFFSRQKAYCPFPNL